MNYIDFQNPTIRALFVEIGMTKLILRSLIQSVVSDDPVEAWQDIEALIERIEQASKDALIANLASEPARLLVKDSGLGAVAFVRSIGTKPGTN